MKCNNYSYDKYLLIIIFIQDIEFFNFDRASAFHFIFLVFVLFPGVVFSSAATRENILIPSKKKKKRKYIY